MGLKDRAKKLVSDQLRPWLLCDVFPIINIGTSRLTLQLPHLEFDIEALNHAGLESAPLVIKEAVKVENVELIFAPFRQPVVTILVQGLHTVFEPRSAEDAWWEKKRDRTAQQKKTAVLFALDPQGATVHTAAQELAEGKASNSLVARFLTSLVLSSIRVEFRDCSVSILSHAHNGLRHCCRIPLSSFELGENNDPKGFPLSGGLLGSVMTAARAVWRRSNVPISKYCSVKGLGLKVETYSVDGDGQGSRCEDIHKESGAADIEEIFQQYLPGHSSSDNGGMEVYAVPEICSKEAGEHVVFIKHLALGLRFGELALDALEVNAPVAAFGLDFEEMHALRILTAQFSGPGEDDVPGSQERHDEAKVLSKSECTFRSRSPIDLWRMGMQKAVELSSRRRLTHAVEAGILRRRYSSLYESWLLELGWARRTDDEASKVRPKSQCKRLQKLYADISETEKKLPLEAVALARRVARRRASVAVHPKEGVDTDVSPGSRSERLKTMYSSFQIFLGSFWPMITLVMTFMQDTTVGLSTWTWPVRRLSVSWLQSLRGVLNGSWTSAVGKDEPAEDDNSRPVSGVQSSAVVNDERPHRTAGRVVSENHFCLGYEKEVDGSSILLSEKKKGWAMTYALKIQKGSVTLASRALESSQSGEEIDAQRKRGQIELEKVLVPAVHFALEKMVLVYGSSANASGATISCGELKADLLSILPSQFPKELLAQLGSKALQKEFSCIGRWAAKLGDNGLILSTGPCPQQCNRDLLCTNNELPFAGSMFDKHWIWQDRQLEAWDRSWAKLSDDESTGSASDLKNCGSVDGMPFLIAEYNSLDDGPSTDYSPGGLIKCSLTMGQLKVSLKSAFFAHIRLLLDKLMVSQTGTHSSPTVPRIKQQRRNQPHISLSKFWDDKYDEFFDMVREGMVAAIPEKSMLFSAVVDSPQVRLSATAAELYEYQHAGNKDISRRRSQLDQGMGATVVVDFGEVNLAMWPPERKETGTSTEGNETSNDWWTHAVDSKLWLKRPPKPALPQDFAEKRYWEHEQVGNNLYMSIEAAALVLELQKDSLKELPVLGPVSLVVETSVCWDQYSSLFSRSKSLSASVGGKISSLVIQSYVHEVSIILQVIDFSVGVLTSNQVRDATSSVTGGNPPIAQNVVAQEEPILLAGSNKESGVKEVPLTACVLTLSMELEKLNFVLGDSRQDYGYMSTGKNAVGVQAQMKQDVGLRYEPREQKLQTEPNDYEHRYNWEDSLVGTDIGKEAYTLIEDILLHISLGDGHQFCMFMGIKDALIRLVDSGSISSAKDLAEIRNHFFTASVSDRRFPSHLSGYKSFSGLVLTEVSLEYFSMKVFGPYAHLMVDESESSSNGSIGRTDDRETTGVLVGGDSDQCDKSNPDLGRHQFSSHLSTTGIMEVEQSPDVNPRRFTSIVRSESPLLDGTKDQTINRRQQRLNNASKSAVGKDQMQWLTASMELGKILVTDGSLDTLIAKVLLVASGGENFHLEFGLDRQFQTISLETQGGLVLVHTEAVATFLQFCENIGRLIVLPIASGSPRDTSTDLGDVGADESWKVRPVTNTYRSSSVPPPSSGKRLKKFKRMSSAPPMSQTPVPNHPAVTLAPTFEGTMSMAVSGVSFILARHSVSDSVPAEGVLFELEMSSMLEVGDSAKKASFDLSRFTILGLQARIPGNARKNPGRIGSRTPQFGSSFKGLSMQVDQLKQPLTGDSSSAQNSRSPGEASETDVGGLLRSTEQLDGIGQLSSFDAFSGSKEKEIMFGSVDSKGLDRSASISKQAEGFHNALSEFNSFILERLSVSCAIERVAGQDKVWKWTDAWQGQCSIVGLDVAITTSEIQLIESLVTPLSSLRGVSKSAAVEIAANVLVEGIKEDTNEADFEIPDGSIIAIKDVREHCYLAAEEMRANKGRYRLVGVLHYTLAGDKALFKVKYQGASSAKKTDNIWVSLLSLHAKHPSGEPFRVHYRPGSGLADLSSTNDGSWEQWQFIPAESSKYEKNAELDIQNPTFKHLFHFVNNKSKNGIAFEENVPVMVKQPGNPFKIKIIAKPPERKMEAHEASTQTEETPLPLPPLNDREAVDLVTSIPHVMCVFDTFIFTVLHEAAGGLHLLPLLRVRVPGTEGVVQAGLSKTRTILQCNVVLEYYETQSSLWVSIINPIATDIFYRARCTKHGIITRKTPVAFFSRFKKVDVVISEPSLDACLFLIGALDLAGPYTVRYSPVRANRCLVENQTGVDVLCRFDQGSSKLDGVIPSWHSDSFLMRHMTSRRDSGPAKVASSLEVYLQKSGKGATSPVLVFLGNPGVLAVRTRLQTEEGRKTTGPMVVVDVSRRSQDGIFVTVSPMVRIRNASGLPLELRCRREAQGEEGAVVVLEDGDTIDDAMGAFDALNLEGELKKALLSLNLGNYRLSIRPVDISPREDRAELEVDSSIQHEWSEDVKGAKPVRAAGLFDKLQYSFNKTLTTRNVESTFGVVFCPRKVDSSNKSGGSNHDAGLHFLIRTSSRRVPVSRPKPAEEQEQHGGYAIVAWQQQQELLLLPTVRLLNLTTSNIAIMLTSKTGRKQSNTLLGQGYKFNAAIKSGGKESMYMDLGDLFLIVKHEDLNLVSKPVGLAVEGKEFSQNTKGGSLRDLEMEIDFGDGIHIALVAVSRGDDGVLEVVFLTRYALQNDSHVALLCCAQKQVGSLWGGFRSARNQEFEWPSSGIVTTIDPQSRISWFDRSTKLLIKRSEADAEAALLDLESVSGSMEISLRVRGEDSVDNRVQLGVQLHIPSAGDSNPSCVIRLVPRYIVTNESGEAIIVCQDGFQEDMRAMVSLGPGERSVLHAQVLPDQKNGRESENGEVGPEILLTLRFRPQEAGWNWSGPVCAASLGSFSVKIRRSLVEESKVGLSSSQKPQKEGLWFAVANVQEEASSLVMTFRRQAADAIPYRIENALRSASITYNQQGLDDFEVLEAGASVGYVWDDLGQPHILAISLAGMSLRKDINPDKLRSWKSFRTSRSKRGALQIPFLNELSNMAIYGDEDEDEDLPKEGTGLPSVGYEVYADGPTRVVRVCEEKDSKVSRQWQSDITSPKSEIEVRIPLFTMTIVEPGKQQVETEREDAASSDAMTYLPVTCLRLTNVLIEALVTPEYTLCQIKAERLDVDVKWQGAPIAAMLRGHGQDRFEKGQTVLHMAVVMSNLAKNPIQLKYASILLQAMDLNLDEDTLMKLVPFYRYSLSESTAPSRQIYFERFEIHPIKIVASFLPGNPRADYSSGQETLRALLHSVIKIPTVRGSTVELNGVLLSNALLTFKQLALKCAQHYSWYAMRGIYIARGSKLLPPGFASLFDDSAASSLDVFFDPSNGSVDLQGLTLGMFGILSRGLRKKGKGGTQRYLGDLQHTVKAAGSNLLFAVVTEVSDSVLKGADANGFDGLLSGFRRGILNVAMKPSVLRGAVVQGGSTRRIKLDRVVGTDEAYMEGYLQAMLDALFKQNYLRVKVIDDQVVLKNLPPNTTLMDEIVGCVRNFLIGEGLLAGESSAAALSSLRRLRGEDERRLGPTVIALCEQLLVIIVVRSLRRQTVHLLRQNNITIIGDDPFQKPESSKAAEVDAPKEQSHQGFFQGINVKRAFTAFALSSVLAYADGRICRHIPNPLVRRIVSGFLLSFVE